MALGYKARAMLAGLAKFGEPSLLAGVACGPVSIKRDVSLERIVEPFPGFGSQRENVDTVRHVLATIDRAANPRVGQTLVHPSEGTFVLDRLLSDNGITRRFIVAGG